MTRLNSSYNKMVDPCNYGDTYKHSQKLQLLNNSYTDLISSPTSKVSRKFLSTYLQLSKCYSYLPVPHDKPDELVGLHHPTKDTSGSSLIPLAAVKIPSINIIASQMSGTLYKYLSESIKWTKKQRKINRYVRMLAKKIRRQLKRLRVLPLAMDFYKSLPTH